ncbi:hypothetical protein BU25DRAFT_455555 [Macroventuria anomochaeta]|uniref:Uncharacterized protein n=1 Tax=Macroventuria anomochaeta TaxID=301207 RepID=A0ACB6SDA8_9PLEO|nr:uncharacterized protein BU25DRAFT_455555 [Macroventuria anomochaeta]KAF2631239.1 hypothetical protein BU25DRAFT_455555 [Macroventuria anomochaeta]
MEPQSRHRMIDLTSVWSNVNANWARTEAMKVVNDHTQHLNHLFSGMISPPVIRLAKQLTGAGPAGFDKAFFLSTGGGSNEAAIHLARFYTGKLEIVGVAAA